MNRPPWQERLFEEQKALSEKIRKLAEFQRTETHAALPKDDQHLLFLQLASMHEYYSILTQRIFRLPRGEANAVVP